MHALSFAAHILVSERSRQIGASSGQDNPKDHGAEGCDLLGRLKRAKICISPFKEAIKEEGYENSQQVFLKGANNVEEEKLFNVIDGSIAEQHD